MVQYVSHFLSIDISNHMLTSYHSINLHCDLLEFVDNKRLRYVEEKTARVELVAKSTSRFVKHCIKTQLYYSGIDWLGRLKLNISWLVRLCNCNRHYHIQPASNNSQCNPININNTLKNIKDYPQQVLR